MLQDSRLGTAKAQQFLDRLLQRQEVEAPRISSRHMEMAKVVSHTHRPPVPFRKYPWHSFLLEAELTQGQTAAGMTNDNKKIEAATFRLVAQCLNGLRQHVSPPPPQT